MNFSVLTVPYSKIDNNNWVLSRFHAFLVTENWSFSDPELIIPDDPYSDPANNFGSTTLKGTVSPDFSYDFMVKVPLHSIFCVNISTGCCLSSNKPSRKIF